MILHIIRHGETQLNKRGVVQGSGIDVNLNEKGRRQAEAFYDFYKGEDYDAIYTSVLKRSIETVKPWNRTGIPTYSTKKLNEIGWGIHEGKEVNSEMTKRYHELINDWYSGKLSSKIEKGESAEELYNRLGEFIENLRKLNANKILICTHGRTMRAFLTLLLDMAPRYMEEFNHVNTGLYVVEMKEKGSKLLVKNDIQHLQVAGL